MRIHLIIIFCCCAFTTHAQDFITRGAIEYEVKINNKKRYTDEDRQRNAWIATLPEFDISYRDLRFAFNRFLYQPGRASKNENSVYTDLDEKKTVVRKSLFSEWYAYDDSVLNIKWKIENETRKIAGFECRKAIGVIYDSVYVVAFYSPEIIPQGGPECFTGLPGMILGLAIPRFYTTWFATRIDIVNLETSKIAPPFGKKGKVHSKKELSEILFKKYQETGWWRDATLEKVYKSLSTFTL
jgi:GLPGLI family protein